MFQNFAFASLKLKMKCYWAEREGWSAKSQLSIVLNNEETENIPDPGENPIPSIGTIATTTCGNRKAT